MSTVDSVNWGILGTAKIARTSFLPALRAAGHGVAYAVAGRDRERARRFAAENGIDHAVEGYATLIGDPMVEAIYNPLPNGLHAEWTIAALRAGKAVLCEKPLTVNAEETEEVLRVARETRRPLWEAFVFLFSDQTRRVLQLLEDGTVGDLEEIDATFHFRLSSRQNIRLDPSVGGGALYDVGCYPIQLARFLFRAEPVAATAVPGWAPEGVDESMYGVVSFPENRRLLFSCSMVHHETAYARLLASQGEIRLTHPYHPGAADTLDIVRDSDVRTEHPSSDRPSFTPAIEHIHAVLRGKEEPRHLAVDESLGNARTIDLLYRSARSGRQESA